MIQTGPFYYKDPVNSPANDYDMYETDSLLNWVIWLLVIFYSVVTVFYIGILINSVLFRYTYVDPSMPIPGTLISDRYDIYWVAYLLTIIVTVLFPSAILMMTLYRNVYGCNIVWFSGILLFVVLHVFSLFIQTIDYFQCDGPCSRDFSTFAWIYWINIFFLVFHALYIIIVGLYWAQNIPLKGQKKLVTEGAFGTEKNTEDVESRIVVGGISQQKKYNLKQRKK